MGLLLLALGATTATAEFERLSGSRPLCCSNGMALDGDLLIVNQAVLNAVRIVDGP